MRSRSTPTELSSPASKLTSLSIVTWSEMRELTKRSNCPSAKVLDVPRSAGVWKLTSVKPRICRCGKAPPIVSCDVSTDVGASVVTGGGVVVELEELEVLLFFSASSWWTRCSSASMRSISALTVCGSSLAGGGEGGAEVVWPHKGKARTQRSTQGTSVPFKKRKVPPLGEKECRETTRSGAPKQEYSAGESYSHTHTHTHIGRECSKLEGSSDLRGLAPLWSAL